MILEYKLDYRASSLIYEKIFLDMLKTSQLDGNILKDGFNLSLFVEADDIETLEDFSTLFATNLPNSIFLYSTKASMVESMPTQKYILPNKPSQELPLCPSCLRKIKEDYNIYRDCNVCNSSLNIDIQSHKKEIEDAVSIIKNGGVSELSTLCNIYKVSLPSKDFNGLDFDILAYDLATIERYTHSEDYELNAIASFEKPIIRLKKSLKFNMDYEEIEQHIINFRLADDPILTLLSQELHNEGIDIVALTKTSQISEPLEVVASLKNIVIVKGNRGIEKLDIKRTPYNPLNEFDIISKEHNLKDKYENIAFIHISKEGNNSILVYGKKYGIIEYLSFAFRFNSISDIFTKIENSDEKGKKLVLNYKDKFEEHYNSIKDIKLTDKEFNIYYLWGIISTILNFSTKDTIMDNAKVIEDNSIAFLGDRGVRIDYKLIKDENQKVSLNALMVIRSAMSFKLAGADELGISYGVIESFVEFLTNELDELKQNMGIESVAVGGSLLSNKRVFSKISKEASMNFNLYFNNEVPLYD